jgi:hypothetical protein
MEPDQERVTIMQHLPEGIGLRTRVSQLTQENTGKIVAVGVATVVLAPIVLPLVRPLLKASFKTGVLVFEKIKGSVAEAGEVLADIAAEAKAEARAESLKLMAQSSKSSATISPQSDEE